MVLESLNDWLAESATEIDPGAQTRLYTYSLINETSPVWGDVLRDLSAVVPEGIVLTQLAFNRAGMSPGEHSEWSLIANGVVADTDNTVALLKQMEGALEASGLFRDVEVLPQGSTAFTYKGKKIAGAIRFELGARLE
jgi:Tfp pilus assembly protein PilN